MKTTTYFKIGLILCLLVLGVYLQLNPEKETFEVMNEKTHEVIIRPLQKMYYAYPLESTSEEIERINKLNLEVFEYNNG
jgi:hypothetical protein